MGKRFTYEEVNNYFKENNCTLLSKEYINNRDLLNYVCSCGQVSQIRFDDFKIGKRCRECGINKNRKHTYESVLKFINYEGYILVTDNYQHPTQKLIVKCPNDHTYSTNFNNFRKGARCRECKKPTMSSLKEEFKNAGCVLLEDKYINHRTRMKYQCKCGNIAYITYKCFKDGQKSCRKCADKKTGDRTRYSYEYVKEMFKKEGCSLLSTDYKNSSTPLDYICSCGNISKIRFGSFLKGNRCKECGIRKVVESRKYSYDEVKLFFDERGCTLLTEDYINNHQKLHYICSCGNEDWKQLYMFLQGQDCRQCGNKKISKSWEHREILYGEDHPNWKPEKSMEERMNNRGLHEHREWRNQVFERDNYICQCCGDNKGGNLAAHHLDGYDWCKASRFDVSNGSTLCETCHQDFHMVYGFGGNTTEQFEEYMEGISWNCSGIYDKLVN